MKLSVKIFLLILLFLKLLNSCVEPYSPKSYEFKDMLVVECVLNDHLEKQEVKLSKLTKLEEDSLIVEKKAIVWRGLK
jgi:hypothetical protein